MTLSVIDITHIIFQSAYAYSRHRYCTIRCTHIHSIDVAQSNRPAVENETFHIFLEGGDRLYHLKLDLRRCGWNMTFPDVVENSVHIQDSRDDLIFLVSDIYQRY